MSIKLQVAGLSLDPVSKSPILVLSTEDNSHILPIWIGSSEAVSISLALQHSEVPRPLTHDLLLNMLEVLGFMVKSAQISRVDEGVFYALVELTNGKELHALDCRPSDAVALALRVGAPISTTQQVIDEAGFEFSDDDENISVPVRAGDGGIAMLAEEFDPANLADPANFADPADPADPANFADPADLAEQEIKNDVAELQELLKPSKHFEKKATELLEKMDPESKYKM